MGARVNHANVAATLDYVDENGTRCLIEEFVDGQDLGRALSLQYFYLDPSLAAWIIHNVAKGLQAAHQVGICHRDLKPSNIMASTDPTLSTIKLTDFGIAKLAENEIQAEMDRFEKDESTLTNSSTLLGAVPYLAPECWTDWSGAGQPIDIWSLGAIGFHLLSGKTPFGGGVPAIMKMAQMQQAGKVELTRPSWFGKHVNTKLLEQSIWDLIVDCLQIDPEARPTADQIVQRCEEWCYAAEKRYVGNISVYPRLYNDGARSQTGYIKEENSGKRLFFHASDFYGAVLPVKDLRVSYSAFSGSPDPRCAPVLNLRPLII